MALAPQPSKMLTPANIRVLTPDGTFTDEGNAFAVCRNYDLRVSLYKDGIYHKSLHGINIFLIH